MEKEGGSPATNHRLKSYKNKGMDSDELRRRREEEGIQLRKQKREQQVSTDTFKNRDHVPASYSNRPSFRRLKTNPAQCSQSRLLPPAYAVEVMFS